MEALDEKHDRYYEHSYAVAQVGWKQCYLGRLSTLYDTANEEPSWLNQTVVTMVTGGSESLRLSSSWFMVSLAWVVYFGFT